MFKLCTKCEKKWIIHSQVTAIYRFKIWGQTPPWISCQFSMQTGTCGELLMTKKFLPLLRHTLTLTSNPLTLNVCNITVTITASNSGLDGAFHSQWEVYAKLNKIKSHTFKLCTKSDRNQTIHSRVVDNLAFSLSNFKWGDQLPDSSQWCVGWTVPNLEGHEAIIGTQDFR